MGSRGTCDARSDLPCKGAGRKSQPLHLPMRPQYAHVLAECHYLSSPALAMLTSEGLRCERAGGERGESSPSCSAGSPKSWSSRRGDIIP
eukprot:scaffold8382_cov26-Tisochrysis_lutea.AAC.6